MDDFLSSIPAVQRLLQSEGEADRPQRNVVFQAIQTALERKLASERETVEVRAQACEQQTDHSSDSQAHTDTESDDREWLEQLAELDLGDTDDSDGGDNGIGCPNTVDSMAWLLTRYAVNRPWIPMSMPESTRDEQLGDMMNTLIEAAGDDGNSSPLRGQTDRGNKSIMHYNGLEDLLALNVPDHKFGEKGVAYVSLIDEIPTTSKILDTIADSDRRLGLAGFLPFVTQGKRYAESSDLEIRRQDDELEDDFSFQWRSHTRLAGDCARVCFLQYTNSMEDLVYPSLIYGIERSLKALLSQIGILDQVGCHSNSRLHFIRLKPVSGESFRGSLEHQAEICVMEVKLIKDLATAFVETNPAMMRSLLNAINFRHSLALESVFRQIALISGLYEAAHRVLETLGVPLLNEEKMENITQHPFIATLHMTALAVQALTLIVQFHLRGLTTPCRFQFLTSTVSNFVLEGANHQPTATKVYASSQKLSCLGDMLEKKVLVFGLKERGSQQRLDIVATPAQLAELWGPVELMVSGPPTTDTMSIVGIRIHRGLLIPTAESAHGMQKWHWVADSSANARIPMADTNMGVDIHTQLRIGAKNYLGLNPIGPARMNKSCPRHGLDDFISEHVLASSLRPLGVRDPLLEWQSFTAGIQGGQGAIVTAQGTLARKPGITCKDQLLNFAGAFKVRMAKLDQMWGLAVSLCTGVMTRVRLRDLVAFYCLKCSPMGIPGIQGLTDRDDSLNGFAQAMYGDHSICSWFESVVPPSKNNCYDRETVERHISKLFREVLVMLKDTGIQENGDLAVARISPGYSLTEARLSASKMPWVKVLKDSSSTATFACILPCCFETGNCACQKSQWRLPAVYQLSTKLDIFTETLNGFEGRHRPLIGKLYRINSANLNIMTKIDGRMKLPDGSFLYYATIKNSALHSVFHEYVPRRPRLRENDSASAFKVIIGGGPHDLQH